MKTKIDRREFLIATTAASAALTRREKRACFERIVERLALAFFLLTASCFLPEEAAAQGRGSSRPYVTVRNGHFVVGNQRLRLWGVNISSHHVIDHTGAEVTVRRMKQLGFNCLHVWLGRGALHSPKKPYFEFRDTQKGDGSPLDLCDYLISLCHDQGLYVSLPTLLVRLDEITPDAFDIIPGTEADRTAWVEGIGNSEKAFPQLKFVDERVKAIYLKHADYFLRRVNPYTGRPYSAEPTIAFWQLQDEMEFLAWPPDIGGDSWFSKQLARHWTAYLNEHFKNEKGLVKAWGALHPGESWTQQTIRLFPVRKLDGMNARRLQDTWAFLYGLSDRFYADYIQAIRRLSPVGVGINVQPVAADSIIYNRAGLIYGALKASSFMCGTGFEAGGSLVEVRSTPTWQPNTTQRPPWEEHYATDPLSLRMAGMAHCPVAGANLTNDPFRGLAPMCRALMAAWQDWDGVFSYWWGYFNDKKKPLASDADYGREGLRYATPESPRECFEICHDEVMLSQHRVASVVFRQWLLPPAAKPTVFRFGRRAIFGPLATEYYHSHWPAIPLTAWQYGSQIQFDPEWNGEMQALGSVGQPLSGALRWPNAVTWDWPRGRVVVDTPWVKAVLGKIEGPFRFGDNIELSGVNRPFACFALAAEDGQPLSRSRRAVLSLVSQSANTGYQFDPTKLTKNKFGAFEAHTGCTNPGGPPILVERVSGRVSLPKLPGRLCRKIDFASRVLATEAATDGVILRQEEPVFYSELIVQ